MDSLVDVNIAIACREEKTFTKVRCYIVNYTANCDWPNKFFYKGCTATKGNGLLCAKSSCGHERNNSKPMYRFQLQLTDSTPSPPVTVTIFDQAKVLLGIEAEEFATRSAENQRSVLREMTSKGEEVDLLLKVKEDLFSGEFVAIVQMLQRVKGLGRYVDEEDEVVAELWRTPSSSPGLGRSPGVSHTPPAVNSSAAELSSSRGGRPSRSRVSKLRTVKSKFADLEQSIMNIIDLTEDE